MMLNNPRDRFAARTRCEPDYAVLCFHLHHQYDHEAQAERLPADAISRVLRHRGRIVIVNPRLASLKMIVAAASSNEEGAHMPHARFWHDCFLSLRQTCSTFSTSCDFPLCFERAVIAIKPAFSIVIPPRRNVPARCEPKHSSAQTFTLGAMKPPIEPSALIKARPPAAVLPVR